MTTITVGSWPGKRLACFVDGKRAFHMAKREHKAFYQRVEKLRAQARTSDAEQIDAMFAFLSISLTVALRVERRQAQPRVNNWLQEQRMKRCQPTIEPVEEDPFAPVFARIHATLERNDRLDAAYEKWRAAGMPVDVPPYPFNFVPKGRI